MTTGELQSKTYILTTQGFYSLRLSKLLEIGIKGFLRNKITLNLIYQRFACVHYIQADELKRRMESFSNKHFFICSSLCLPL